MKGRVITLNEARRILDRKQTLLVTVRDVAVSGRVLLLGVKEQRDILIGRPFLAQMVCTIEVQSVRKMEPTDVVNAGDVPWMDHRLVWCLAGVKPVAPRDYHDARLGEFDVPDSLVCETWQPWQRPERFGLPDAQELGRKKPLKKHEADGMLW